MAKLQNETKVLKEAATAVLYFLVPSYRWHTEVLVYCTVLLTKWRPDTGLPKPDPVFAFPLQ